MQFEDEGTCALLDNKRLFLAAYYGSTCKNFKK